LVRRTGNVLAPVGVRFGVGLNRPSSDIAPCDERENQTG
jgi:hypothetical protein